MLPQKRSSGTFLVNKTETILLLYSYSMLCSQNTTLRVQKSRNLHCTVCQYKVVLTVLGMSFISLWYYPLRQTFCKTTLQQLYTLLEVSLQVNKVGLLLTLTGQSFCKLILLLPLLDIEQSNNSNFDCLIALTAPCLTSS